MAGCILLIAVSVYLVHLPSHGGRSQATGVSTQRWRREKYRRQTSGSEADLIANATQQDVSMWREREEDPTPYAKRISELKYFKPPQDIDASGGNRRSDDALSEISGNEDAIAFFRLLKPFIETHLDNAQQVEQITAVAAQAILNLIRQRAIRDWIDNDNVQKDMLNAIDDYLYEVICDKYKIVLTPNEMDEILEQSLQLAKNYPNLVQSQIGMNLTKSC